MEEKHFGKGNDGKSTLSSQFKISKSDPRFSAIGTLDELAAEVYLCLAANSDMSYGAGFNVDCDAASDGDFEAAMREILGAIGKISDGMAYPRDSRYAVTENELSRVNELIAALSRFDEQSAKPANELASRLNLARTIARRAEREVVAADLKFGSPKNAAAYLNGLSAFFAAQVKRANAIAKGRVSGVTNATNTINAARAANAETPIKKSTDNAIDEDKIVTSVVNRVMDKFGMTIGLDEAKILTDIIEKEATRRGKKAVVAVCNEQGNPISVHVMDGAFLVSYEVAAKKAYTSVAVKMSTAKLQEEVEKGNSLYGLQTVDQLIYLGGGEPLVLNGQIVGGVGVSGGTAAEDTDLGAFAARLFTELFDKQS